MKKLSRNLLPANRFAPSKFSGDGFTGNDTRTVPEIIAADHLAVEALGASCEAIAKALAVLFDKAEAAPGEPVDIRPGFTATHYEARGKLPCPFRCNGAFIKGEVSVTDASSGKTVCLTRLGIHLIGQHGFFQGVGSRYRIDPEDAVSIGGKGFTTQEFKF